MRIISGKYKNRELKSPNSPQTHPMGERERLAIFNMLISELGTPDLAGKTVLDLFAGTGALGLEALSRGATSATFVENNGKTLQILKENLKNVENIKIIKADVYKLDIKEKYDIIFIDPPYDKFDKTVLNFQNFLKKGGILVVSSPEPIDDTSRKYANCHITTFKAKVA